MIRAHYVSLRWLILIPSFLLFLSPSLTVAGVGLRWLDLHPHPCKPSQIGASYLPGPSSFPSYRFGTVLSALALAVSRASIVDAPLQKLQARPQIIHTPFLVVHFGMANKQQEPRKRKYVASTDGVWTAASAPVRQDARCIDTWVPVMLIDAAVEQFTLDASNYDPANPNAPASGLCILICGHARPRGRLCSTCSFPLPVVNYFNTYISLLSAVRNP
ncbi:hypothetical protein DFH09DRAFT_1497758 [Mycena vulgaris]|nr:hypothetical protein DFH09DRAFT_1497758 [Mycena vulgaris]